VFDATPSDAVGYVFSAYLFFLLMVLVYISILGAKFQRINRELGELIEELEAENAEPDAVVEAGVAVDSGSNAPRKESSV
jgi:hypothetical protein